MAEQELRQIQANVRLALDHLGQLSDVDFGLNQESADGRWQRSDGNG